MANVEFTQIKLSDFKEMVDELLKKHLQQLAKPTEKQVRLLSRKQTAELLCISLPTLNDWTKSGVLKAHRIGTRVLYKEQDIYDSLNEVNSFPKRRTISW